MSLSFAVFHVSDGAVSLFTDNAVLRLMLVRGRRLPGRLSTAAVPLVCAVLFVMFLPLLSFEWLPLSGGRILFFFTSMGYLFHSGLGPFMNAPDPLGLAVKERTGDQFVLTGVSPLEWVTAHVVGVVYESLIISSAYLPVGVICWYLGGVSFRAIALVGIIGLLVAVTLRLLVLLWKVLPAVATAVSLLLFSAWVLPLMIRPGTPPFLRAGMTPLLFLNPLVLVKKYTALMEVIPIMHSDTVFSAFLAWDSNGLAALPTVLACYVGLWFLMGLGLVVGRPRGQCDFHTVSSTNRGIGLPFGLPGVTGPAEGETRSLGHFEIIKLMYENSSLRLRGLWECVWLLTETFAAGCVLVPVAELLAGLGTAYSESMTPGWTSAGLVAMAMVLTVLSVTESCFSVQAVHGSWFRKRLLVPIHGVLLVRLGLIGWGLHGFLGLVDPALGSRRSAGLLLFAGFAAVSTGIGVCGSVLGRSRLDAQWLTAILLTLWLGGPPAVVFAVSGLVSVPVSAAVLASLSPLYGALVYFVPPAAFELAWTPWLGGQAGQGAAIVPQPWFSWFSLVGIAGLVGMLLRRGRGHRSPRLEDRP